MCNCSVRANERPEPATNTRSCPPASREPPPRGNQAPVGRWGGRGGGGETQEIQHVSRNANAPTQVRSAISRGRAQERLASRPVSLRSPPGSRAPTGRRTSEGGLRGLAGLRGPARSRQGSVRSYRGAWECAGAQHTQHTHARTCVHTHTHTNMGAHMPCAQCAHVYAHMCTAPLHTHARVHAYAVCHCMSMHTQCTRVCEQVRMHTQAHTCTL